MISLPLFGLQSARRRCNLSPINVWSMSLSGHVSGSLLQFLSPKSDENCASWSQKSLFSVQTEVNFVIFTFFLGLFGKSWISRKIQKRSSWNFQKRLGDEHRALTANFTPIPWTDCYTQVVILRLCSVKKKNVLRQTVIHFERCHSCCRLSISLIFGTLIDG